MVDYAARGWQADFQKFSPCHRKQIAHWSGRPPLVTVAENSED